MAKKLRPHNEMFKLSDADLAAIVNNVREEQQRRSPGADQAADLKGVESAKRALLVAAVGGHSILFIGRKACGKTSLRSLAAALDHFDTYEALPCPCGNSFDPRTVCHCTREATQAHRLTWPETTMVCEVPLVAFRDMNSRLKGIGFAELVRMKSEAAPYFRVDTLYGECESLMKAYSTELGITLRQHRAALDIAATIARLAHRQAVQVEDLMEALNYRCRLPV